MHWRTFGGVEQTAQNELMQLLVTGQHGGHEEIAVDGAVMDVGITGIDQMASPILGQAITIGEVGTRSLCQRFARTDNAFVFHDESSLSMCVTRLKRELCWNGERCHPGLI